jgi:hypothetical protein
MKLIVLTRALTLTLGAILLSFIFLTRNEPYLWGGPTLAFIVGGLTFFTPVFTGFRPRENNPEANGRGELYLLRSVCFFATMLSIAYFPFDLSTGGMWKWGVVALVYIGALIAPYLFGFVSNEDKDAGWIGVAILTLILVPSFLGIGISWMGSGSKSTSENKLGPVTGDRITLARDVVLTFTDDAWDARGDKDAILAKLERGEAGLLPSGVTVKVVEVGIGWRSIVPLDGAHSGRTGKVPHDLLK